MSTHRSRVCGLATPLVLLLTSTLLADGIIRDGVGARSSGRGGTNLGFADNGEVLLDNPGGMVNIAGQEIIECGGDVLITDFQYSDPQNAPTSAFNDPFPMGQFALVRKTDDGMFAYGAGAYSSAGFGAQYLLEGPAPFAGERHYKSIGALLRLQPGLAARLTDRWSAGGSFGLGVSHIELEAPYTLQAGALAGTPTMLDLQQTGAGVSWSVGTQYMLTEATTLGATYQEETRMQLGGNTRVEIPGLGQSYYDSELDWVWPRSIGLGAMHRACECRRYGVDVIWYDWSAAMDQLDLKLSQPSNPIFAAVGGPNVHEILPTRWRDSVSVRVGLEQSICTTDTLRLGYVWHRNPIPDSTLTNLIPAILEHSFTTGYGKLIGGYNVDLAYQFSFGPTRHVGDSILLGDDFSDSRMRSHVHWVMISFMRAR